MKPTSPMSLAFLLALSFGGGACVTGPEVQPVPAELRGPGADPAAVLEELGSGGALSEGHQLLEVLVGEWDVVLYSAASGESLARGTASLSWVLGGRALEWSTELVVGDRSAPSLALFGYDPRANLYQLAWCSGLTSAMSLARGRGELDAIGIRLVAEVRDPATAQISRSRVILRLASEGVYEMIQEAEQQPGLWAPITRTVYSRPGAPATSPPGLLDGL